jgi:hypothetical protein
MGWFRNVVSVILPGVPQTFDAAGQIANGELPIPKNPLPLPDPVASAILPDAVEDAWNEHIDGENAKFRGLWNDAKGSIGDFLTGAGEIAQGNFSEGAGHIWNSATRGATGGVGVGLLDVRRNGAIIEAGLAPFGLAPQTRGLTPEERAVLTRVYGDTLDLDAIRLKVGGQGLLGIRGDQDRALTSGNTIYMRKDPNNADDYPGLTAAQRQEQWLELLVHEAAHVWQFQNKGSGYQTDSLLGQILPPAIPHPTTVGGESTKPEYDWRAAQDAGLSWEQMNPEQQAELMEQAYEAGFFNDLTPGQLYNPTAVFKDDQGNDRTAFVQAAIEKMRARQG